ncbi:protein GLUTAMINE DUMPER 1-like [Zingiber officinale]|uniref:protein GLUTAMINE DUMPER 1-like n=1 Tax=Zingiber officinale TaxID=94328 RepID=UPI001C4DBF7C|nr:protein GLUTAMINE DUMPER 1-like [Zingiber officinale]
MRAAAALNATAATAAAVAGPAATGGGAHLAWQSPVAYLFGGLAAMLGLIALALLILACSYWKLSGYLDAGESRVELYVKPSSMPVDAPPCYEEKVVVIMAGEEKPTHLATAVESRGARSANVRQNAKEAEKAEEAGVIKAKEDFRMEKDRIDLPLSLSLELFALSEEKKKIVGYFFFFRNWRNMDDSQLSQLS